MNSSFPVFEYITCFYSSVELPREPISIKNVKLLEHSFYQACRALRVLDEACRLDEWAKRRKTEMSSVVQAVGLNTVGMLSDRLSILCIKKAMQSQNGRVSESLQDQIREINNALNGVCPGRSSGFNKVTNLSCEIPVEGFAAVLGDLCATNLLLWLSQDVLYLRGPEELPDSELREYILIFSRLNLRRNLAISMLEGELWSKQ